MKDYSILWHIKPNMVTSSISLHKLVIMTALLKAPYCSMFAAIRSYSEFINSSLISSLLLEYSNVCEGKINCRVCQRRLCTLSSSWLTGLRLQEGKRAVLAHLADSLVLNRGLAAGDAPVLASAVCSQRRSGFALSALSASVTCRSRSARTLRSTCIIRRLSSLHSRSTCTRGMGCAKCSIHSFRLHNNCIQVIIPIKCNSSLDSFR